MALKIEITDSKIENISGVSKKTGNDFSFRKQRIWFHVPGSVYPLPSEFILDKDDPGYPVGLYVLADSSVYVDQNGRLAIRPVLHPIPLFICSEVLVVSDLSAICTGVITDNAGVAHCSVPWQSSAAQSTLLDLTTSEIAEISSSVLLLFQLRLFFAF